MDVFEFANGSFVVTSNRLKSSQSLNNKKHPTSCKYWNSGKNRRSSVLRFGAPSLVTDMEYSNTYLTNRVLQIDVSYVLNLDNSPSVWPGTIIPYPCEAHTVQKSHHANFYCIWRLARSHFMILFGSPSHFFSISQKHKSVKSVEFAESQNRGINIFVLRKSTHRRGHTRACAECVEESKII